MAAVDLKALIGRLDGTCRSTLEGAAGFALMRTHYNVEMEHWLSRLLAEANTDIPLILAHYGVELGAVGTGHRPQPRPAEDGNSRPPGLSPDIVETAKQAGCWLPSKRPVPGAVRPPALGHAFGQLAGAEAQRHVGGLQDALRRRAAKGLRQHHRRLQRAAWRPSRSPPPASRLPEPAARRRCARAVHGGPDRRSQGGSDRPDHRARF